MSDMNSDLAAAVNGLMWLPVVVVSVLIMLYAAHRAGRVLGSRAWAAVTGAPPLVHAIVVAVLATSAVHLALTPAHLDEAPLLGVLFGLSSLGGVAVCAAAYARVRGWRLAAAGLLATMVVGYTITRVIGFEDWDALGLATKGIELAGLGLIAADLMTQRNSAPEAQLARGWS